MREFAQFARPGGQRQAYSVFRRYNTGAGVCHGLSHKHAVSAQWHLPWLLNRRLSGKTADTSEWAES